MSDLSHPSASANRINAGLIALASLLSVLFMAIHPSVQAPTLAEAIPEMVREAAVNRTVHSILIALIVLMAVGFTGFAHDLNLRRPATVAGLVAFVFGAVMESGAAVVNGLAVTSFTSKLAQAGPEHFEAARPVLNFAFALNQGLAQTGVMAFAAAMICWSIALMHKSGFARIVGAFGILAGLIESTGLISGHLQLNVHGMQAVVVLQTLWNLAGAAYLWRPREA